MLLKITSSLSVSLTLLVVLSNCPTVSASAQETMTLCLNCSNTDGCASDDDSLEFEVPVSTCFSPTELYPDSGDVWGEFDILDECNERGVKRVIYDSKNGTCLGDITDTYILQYDKCLGPFGAPRPWGVFECSES